MSNWLIAAIILLASLAFGAVQTMRLAHSQLEIAEQKAAYAQRDAEASAALAAAVQKRQAEVRALEAKAVLDVAAVSAKFEREKSNVAAQTRKALADLHTGVLSLRVQLAASTCQDDRGEGAKAGAAAGQRDDAPGSGLLAEPDAAFLVSEAARADQVVAQLAAAQAVILKDREICR